MKPIFHLLSQSLADGDNEPDYVKNFDLEEYCKINFVVSLCVSALAFVYMCGLIYMTKIVVRLQGQYCNLIVLMMLCSIFEALGIFIQFNVDSRIYYTRGEWQPTQFWNLFVTIFPITFYLLMVVINSRNWINYYFKIKQMAT
jgi:hypothetical protein